MTEKERFISALKREPITGHVPHFELAFYLTMEAIGKVHPTHRVFSQWDQMSAKEKELQYKDKAACYVETAEKYQHSAIFIQNTNLDNYEEIEKIVYYIRELSGDKYFVMSHGDATYAIPDGENMYDMTMQFYDDPEHMKQQAETNIETMLGIYEEYKRRGISLDGVALCSDYCFNTNPFLSPSMFSEFVTPYLAKLIAGLKSMGFYVIKHTDGNIMPILDQIAECGPDALHSLDPQGGVDLAAVKKQYGDKLCLIGNVNCSLLQTGTPEELIADVRRALRDGMPGGGYIFSTSNCVYSGLPLERYELMHKVWLEEGLYT